jgi:hypothetical protein
LRRSATGRSENRGKDIRAPLRTTNKTGKESNYRPHCPNSLTDRMLDAGRQEIALAAVATELSRYGYRRIDGRLPGRPGGAASFGPGSPGPLTVSRPSPRLARRSRARRPLPGELTPGSLPMQPVEPKAGAHRPCRAIWLLIGKHRQDTPMNLSETPARRAARLQEWPSRERLFC